MAWGSVPSTALGQVVSLDTSGLAKLEARQQRNPRNRQLRITLANYYLMLGRGREAEGLVDGYLRTRHASPELFTIVAAGQALDDRTAEALETLDTGLEAYPYAKRLERLRLNIYLARGAFPTAAAVLALPDSFAGRGLRLEAAAEIALAQRDYVEGLLLAEEAHYVLGGDLTSGLAAEQRDAYARLLTAAADDRIAARESRVDTSWQAAYLAALGDAAKAVAATRADLPADLVAYAKLRTAALRLFVERGNLYRSRRPLLVDLYVMDRAGFLEVSSADMLAADGALGGTPEVLRFYPRKSLELTEYLGGGWAADVEAFLARAAQ